MTSVDRTGAKALYGKALAAFADDDVLSEAEAADLRRLRDTLGLRDADAQEVERQTVYPRYERKLAEVLRDEAMNGGDDELNASVLRRCEYSRDRFGLTPDPVAPSRRRTGA